MASRPMVLVVSADAETCQAIRASPDVGQWDLETYRSTTEFLAGIGGEAADCVLVTVRPDDLRGLEICQALAKRGLPTPVIVIADALDADLTELALKAGALGVIPKPINQAILVASIRQAVEQQAQSRQQTRLRSEVESRLALLTPRQRQVMEMVVNGKITKLIARQLGTSTRTIEVHRARIMKKLHVDSVADLVTLAIECGMRQLPFTPTEAEATTAQDA